VHLYSIYNAFCQFAGLLPGTHKEVLVVDQVECTLASWASAESFARVQAGKLARFSVKNKI